MNGEPVKLEIGNIVNILRSARFGEAINFPASRKIADAFSLGTAR